MTWQVFSFALLALVLLGGFVWYERSRPPAKVLALVAALAALAVVGRLAFAAVPNVKPTTDIVLLAGYALGPVPGFAVGAISALASNVFLGQGPWTAWQMVAWGGCGAIGALLAWVMGGRELGRIPLAIACGLAGLAFGAFMDVYQWTLAAQQDLATYLAIAGTSLPYNLAHALGNVVFCLLIGPVFIRSLRRYRRRFEVRWEAPATRRTTAGAAAAAVVAALAVTVAATVQPPATSAAAGTPEARAADYLLRAQNRDGGFGAKQGQSSSPLYSGWTALGLAAAGYNPRDIARPRGKTVLDYLGRAGRGSTDIGELERTILVLGASGLSAKRFAGRNLLAQLRKGQGADGSWKGNVAWTAFGAMALRAAGESQRSSAVQKAAAYLEQAQHDDGGWGFVPKAMSDVDDTGAVLQALAAAGRRGGPAVAKGVGYLRETQSSDGGWGQLAGRTSNAQSSSWAVQGLVAAKTPFGSLRADPLRYLRGLQGRDGHFSYASGSDQTQVWVTAQALTALRRKAFPIAPVARGKEPAKASDQGAATSAGGGGDGLPPAVPLLVGAALLTLALVGALRWRTHHRATA